MTSYGVQKGDRVAVYAYNSHYYPMCREKLAGFKCPKKTIIADKLPKNPSGKILNRS
jgi:acyl-coenzyme A synthetase/AMP-(fatty) acid ligase